MKSISWGVLTLTLTTLAACNKSGGSSGSSSSNNSTVTTTSTTGTSTTSGGGTTASTTGGTTTGGASAKVYAFTAVMAGGQTWSIGYVPSNLDTNPSSTNYAMGDFISLNANTVPFFASDSRYRVKVKVLPATLIYSTTKKQMCYGRLFPASQDNCNGGPCAYTKLSYSIGIRDITLSGGTYSLGGIYAVKTISQQAVDAYSPVFDWSAGQFPGRNTGGNIVGHAIAVFNVSSDTQCLASSAYCPVSSHPTKSCWDMQVELATDSTQDF